MTSLKAEQISRTAGATRAIRPVAVKLLGVSMLALALAACKHTEDPARVAGWTLIDPVQRHPILVSQEPATLSLRIHKGASGLTPRQRAEVLDFADRFRASDTGNSRLVIAGPSGAANEIASMNAVQDVRALLSEQGFAVTDISVEAYDAHGLSNPPVRVSYMRYVAEAPRCGLWPTNLAREPQNLPYPNFGCATQHNFAAQISNPADLLGPRSETPRSSERRDVVMEKYFKGDSTAARRGRDENLKVETQ